ncbi:protein DGCR6-like [Limulus polyphemus]|uniref:Protein DGCR6-like n=1 Tax=Limulus polyphemus TaxID=6850 RepID=A0ABM1B8T8_LIMPO|nr:protein DGCR6-like [Limulus polyphemus]
MAHCQYVPNIDESLMSAVKEELARKEQLQQKHYFYLNELQNMARELPPKYQQRLPYELLSSLANSLLDGTVFEIVRGLKEIQLMKEKHLYEKRMKIINSHRGMKDNLQKKHKEILSTHSQDSPQILTTLRSSHEKELQEIEKRQTEEEGRVDMKIIIDLDQAVSDQQVTLEKAGVPGFFVTNNSNEIRLQMYLLEFILKLRSVELPND